jgi:predicted ATP-dependent endonuclease of OLD family
MQKILIKEFQAIAEMEIELSNMLILIGEQASGKSTISKLIYFFKSLPQDLIDLIYDNLETEADLKPLFWNKVWQKFYNYFGSTRHLPDFEIKYYYDQDKFISLSLYPDKGLNIYINPENFYQRIFFSFEIKRLIQNVRQLFSKQTNAYERRAFQRAMNDLETYIKTLFNESRIPLFFPAGRNITVSYPDQFKLEFYGSLRSARSDLAHQEPSQSKIQSVDLNLMISFLEQTERIKQRFKSNGFQGLVEEKRLLGMPVDSDTLNIVQTNIEKILHGQYRQDQYGEKIFYDAENYVYLNNASSGQQEVIRILQDIFLIVLDKEKAFRVIEEPEAHLYPLAQKYLIELLAIVLNQTDSQIIITTHSPYILSILNNLLFAKRVNATNHTASAEVGAIIPPISWIEPDTTDVYFLKDGRCESIFDHTTGLIDQNYLDEISEELGADFQDLYHIHARSFA